MKRLLRSGYRVVMGLRSLAAKTGGGGLRVFYGGARAGDIGGPLVKVKRLKTHFPEYSWGFNLVYHLSGAPYLPGVALRLLKRRGVAIIANQNGVFYPAWYPGNWRAMNREMAAAYHLADHVLWQSEFCRAAAERFLGSRDGDGEVLYNAVDTNHFTPVETPRHGDGFSFLLTGKINNHIFYRIEASLRGLAAARGQGLDVRLILAGWISPEARARCRDLAGELHIADAITLTGSYSQQDAPTLYRTADAYLMLKHNDPCPNTVIEAMACGLPVLYSATGGVPELVGDAAGVGLPCQDDWENPHWPGPQTVADGMADILNCRDEMGRTARRRAVERFDMGHWIARHRSLFDTLLETRS